MKRFSVSLAIVIAALVGCAAFVALLPWGDPCSFAPPSDGPGCPIVSSPLQDNIRNASFFGVCLFIGFVGGLLARSHRLVVGALSPPLAALITYFVAHWIFGIGWPQQTLPWTSSRIFMTGEYFAVMAAVGLVGAALSRYVRLTTASSAA